MGKICPPGRLQPPKFDHAVHPINLYNSQLVMRAKIDAIHQETKNGKSPY